MAPQVTAASWESMIATTIGIMRAKNGRTKPPPPPQPRSSIQRIEDATAFADSSLVGRGGEAAVAAASKSPNDRTEHEVKALVAFLTKAMNISGMTTLAKVSLTRCVTSRRFAHGEAIFRAGEVARFCYVPAIGEVELLNWSKAPSSCGAQTATSRTVSPGTLFGQDELEACSGLLSGADAPPPARASTALAASSPTQLILIDHAAHQRVLKSGGCSELLAQLDFVSKLPLFSRVQRYALEQLVSYSRPLSFAAGDIIVAQGDAVDCLMLILEGEASVLVEVPEAEGDEPGIARDGSWHSPPQPQRAPASPGAAAQKTLASPGNGGGLRQLTLALPVDADAQADQEAADSGVRCVEVATLGVGSVIGDIALAKHQETRSASVVASAAVRVLRIGLPTFRVHMPDEVHQALDTLASAKVAATDQALADAQCTRQAKRMTFRRLALPGGGGGGLNSPRSAGRSLKDVSPETPRSRRPKILLPHGHSMSTADYAQPQVTLVHGDGVMTVHSPMTRAARDAALDTTKPAFSPRRSGGGGGGGGGGGRSWASSPGNAPTSPGSLSSDAPRSPSSPGTPTTAFLPPLDRHASSGGSWTSEAGASPLPSPSTPSRRSLLGSSSGGGGAAFGVPPLALSALSATASEDGAAGGSMGVARGMMIRSGPAEVVAPIASPRAWPRRALRTEAQRALTSTRTSLPGTSMPAISSNSLMTDSQLKRTIRHLSMPGSSGGAAAGLHDVRSAPVMPLAAVFTGDNMPASPRDVAERSSPGSSFAANQASSLRVSVAGCWSAGDVCFGGSSTARLERPADSQPGTPSPWLSFVSPRSRGRLDGVVTDGGAPSPDSPTYGGSPRTVLPDIRSLSSRVALLSEGGARLETRFGSPPPSERAYVRRGRSLGGRHAIACQRLSASGCDSSGERQLLELQGAALR